MMVTRARKSSEASEMAKNKKPRENWGGSGKGEGTRRRDFRAEKRNEHA